MQHLDQRSTSKLSRSELSAKQAAKNAIDFCQADRNISSKSLASYFQSKKRKSKLLDDRWKRKKQLDRPAEGVYVRLRRWIIDLLSIVCCRSLSKSVVFDFCN